MTCTISSTQDSKSRCWEGHVISLSQITQRITWVVGINHHKTWVLQILSVSTNCMFSYKDHIQYLRISDPSIWEERGFHKYLLSQTSRYYESGGWLGFGSLQGCDTCNLKALDEGGPQNLRNRPKNSAQKRANYFLRDSQQVCPKQWRTSNSEKINATSLKTKPNPVTDRRLHSLSDPLDFEKWGCEHRMILLIPHKKKTQVSSWWFQSSRTCLSPTGWSSQPTSMFSLLETKHTQPRIDS